MLAQAARAQKSGEGIVFLGWEPHPMNANLEMIYLTGGDDWSSGRTSAARRSHQRPQGLRRRSARTSASSCRTSCSRLDMENEIMGAILDDGEDPDDAAAAWLRPTRTRSTPGSPA